MKRKKKKKNKEKMIVKGFERIIVEQIK